MLRQSIERDFEIMGEAMRRLQDRDPDWAPRISTHPQIIPVRNVPIHGYDLIDPDAAWRVIRQDLPVLVEEGEGGNQ